MTETIPKNSELQLSREYAKNFLGKSQESFDKIPPLNINSSILNKIRTSFLKNYSKLLSPQDLLPEIFPELKITRSESNAITKFLELDKIGIKNPTNYLVIKQVIRINTDRKCFRDNS